MKITAVKHFAVKVGFRCRFIVKIETDAGIHGLGEVGIRFWGAAIEQAIEHLSQLVIGQDPFSTEAVSNILSGRFFPVELFITEGQPNLA